MFQKNLLNETLFLPINNLEFWLLKREEKKKRKKAANISTNKKLYAYWVFL